MRGDWAGHCGSSRHHRRGFFISCVKIGLVFLGLRGRCSKGLQREGAGGQMGNCYPDEKVKLPSKGWFATDPDSELLACNAQNLFTHLGEETLPPPCQDWLERLRIIFGIIYFFETIRGRSHITSAAGGGRGGKPKADHC